MPGKCDRCSTEQLVMNVRYPGQRLGQQLCLECNKKTTREMVEKNLQRPPDWSPE